MRSSSEQGGLASLAICLGRRLRAASIGLALLLGVAFGNIVAGVPLNADGNITISLIDLLNPFALLVGVTTVAMFALHGAIFLTLKTGGELRTGSPATPALIVTFFVLNTLVVIAMVVLDQITERYTTQIWPVVFPAGALLALVGVWLFLRRGQPLRAFVCSSAMIALLLVSGAIELFPNLLPLRRTRPTT